MIIEAFDMSFGECILCSDNEKNSCLLIDCGSLMLKEKTNVVKLISDRISSFETKDAMLSHFHDDHINGLIKLIEGYKTHFDILYLPNIFDVNRHPNYVDIEIFRLILKYLYTDIKIGEKIERILNGTDRIFLLNKNDNFDNDVGKLNILWPPKGKILYSKSETNLQSMLRQHLSEEILDDVYSVSDRISIIMVSSASNYKNDSLNNVPHDVIDSKEYSDIDEKIGEIQKKIKRIRSIKSFNKWIADMNSILDRHGNEISIVCTLEKGNRCIFTGDITKNHFNTIIRENPGIFGSSELFDLIKVPHHGTERYYSEDIEKISFKTILISNGNNNKRNPWKISSKYCTLRKDYDVMCTNSDEKCCEYHSNYYCICGHHKKCNIKSQKDCMTIVL